MTLIITLDYSAENTSVWLSDFFYDLAKRTFTYLDLHEAFSLSVNLVSAETIRRINREYRQSDQPTDVIAFAFSDTTPLPVLENGRHLGEIYLAESVIEEQALTFSHSTKVEMRTIFVHGLLHLLGYDHQTDADEKAMTRLNELILEGVPDHA